MTNVILKISTGFDERTVDFDRELSIGRTSLADLQLDDPGLSRINTTIFRDEGDLLVVDENSSNGTFLNGKRISGAPVILRDGDVLKMGSETRVSIEFAEESKKESRKEAAPESDHSADKEIRTPKTAENKAATQKESENDSSSKIVLLVGASGIILIVLLTGLALIVASYFESDEKGQVNETARNLQIPIRVIDPLGGQEQAGLNQLAEYWEVQEADVSAGDLSDISGSETVDGKEENFNVSVEFWQKQRNIALERRNSPTGNDPPGTQVPRELYGDGIVKQKAKIREMQNEGYVIPMDFADLAQKRNNNELVELRMATDYWVLEVGGSSNTKAFTGYNFDDQINSPTLAPSSNDYNILLNLANNFSGMKYDLLNPNDRRQMKIRLLRMIHPRAKPILIEIAKSYRAKFNRPLRVTSLQRSMQYQISLNKTNPNSYRVRGKGSLPPHTSGCAIDLARKHMTAEEQNFLMNLLAQKEREGSIDALREGNVNACFHIFIYDDGQPPSGY